MLNVNVFYVFYVVSDISYKFRNICHFTVKRLLFVLNNNLTLVILSLFFWIIITPNLHASNCVANWQLLLVSQEVSIP